MLIGKPDLQGAHTMPATLGSTPHFCRSSPVSRQPRHVDHIASEPTWLTQIAGSHEGVHLARTRHGSDEQEGRISRDRGLMPKHIFVLDIPYRTQPINQPWLHTATRHYPSWERAYTFACVRGLNAHIITPCSTTPSRQKNLSRAPIQYKLPMYLKLCYPGSSCI